MRFRVFSSVLLAFALAFLPASAPAAGSREKKNVESYDGAFYLITDGGIPQGPCFRISGRVTAPNFFDDLKRFDYSDADSVFRRGNEVVTQFPDTLQLVFVLRDFPCPAELQQTATRTYLTRELVGSLRLSLYWKHGVEMRPIPKVISARSTVQPVTPYSPDAVNLPERFEWAYEIVVPSADVPLTDSLVLIFRMADGRTADGHMAARVAARL